MIPARWDSSFGFRASSLHVVDHGFRRSRIAGEIDQLPGRSDDRQDSVLDSDGAVSATIASVHAADSMSLRPPQGHSFGLRPFDKAEFFAGQAECLLTTVFVEPMAFVLGLKLLENVLELRALTEFLGQRTDLGGLVDRYFLGHWSFHFLCF